MQTTRREALPKHAFQRLERQCTLAAIRYLGKKAVLPFSLNGNGLFSDQAQDACNTLLGNPIQEGETLVQELPYLFQVENPAEVMHLLHGCPPRLLSFRKKAGLMEV